jgi:hypothetical protein
MRRTAVIGLVGLVLATGCSTNTGLKLSSLARDAKLTPIRQQSEAQQQLDDRACEQWTRATKGKDEPLPSSDLRYAACMIARGYQASVEYSDLSSPSERSLDTVLREWRECRADKIELGVMAAPGYSDASRDRAVTCLQKLGYTVTLRRL